jgi:hypothetical protein
VLEWYPVSYWSRPKHSRFRHNFLEEGMVNLQLAQLVLDVCDMVASLVCFVDEAAVGGHTEQVMFFS